MLTEQEFRDLVASVDRAGSWPVDAALGALHFQSSKTVLAGVRTVTEGRVISCADRAAASRVFEAAEGTPAALTSSTEAAHDWLAVNEEVRYAHHGRTAMTHLDSLGHFFYQGRGHDGSMPAAVSDHGVTVNDIRPAAGGVTGRGILLDLPDIIGSDSVAPDRTVSVEQVENWLSRKGVAPRAGDLLFVRTGRPQATPSAANGYPDVGTLDLDCARWVHDSRFSVVLSDAGLDTTTPLVENVVTPWHVLLLVAMGVFLVDCADLEELSGACAALRRYEFLALVAALPLPGATASPVNPLAVL